MDEEEFWTLIAALDGEVTEEGIEQLTDRLAGLPTERITGFADRLAEALFALDTYALYSQPTPAAPDGLGHGDDGFLYFRCGIVALGREQYVAIRADPTLLATVEPDWAEELLSVASEAWEEATDSPWEHETPLSYETASNESQWPPPSANQPPGNRAPLSAGGLGEMIGEAVGGFFRGLFGGQRAGGSGGSSAWSGDAAPGGPVSISWGGNVVPLKRKDERPEFYEGAAAELLNELFARTGMPPGVTTISLVLQLGNRWHWTAEDAISVDGIPELDIWIESPWQELRDWPESTFAQIHAASCAKVIHQILTERNALTPAVATELNRLAAAAPDYGPPTH